MKHWKNRNLLGGLLLLWAGHALAGFSLDSTRIIFTESDNTSGVRIGVTSNAKSLTPYVVQTNVTQGDEDTTGNTPFVTTPSLFRLDPNNTQPVRILKKSDGLPQDRESVFYFNALALPSSDANGGRAERGELQIASNIVIKLFYRPNNLPMTFNEAMGKLTFSASGREVQIRNPTPYYITLANLSVDGKAVSLGNKSEKDAGMIAPFGERTYPAPATRGAVTWGAIDDFGNTEVLHGTMQ